MKNHIALALLALATLNSPLSTAFAQGTAFTYQGRLNSGTSPANGSYNLTFSLFNVASGGSAIAGPVTNSAVAVTNGLFTVTIDFGAGSFNGQTNWLQVGVETNGAGSFTLLSPYQQLTPTPYALFAEKANGLSGTGLAGAYSSAVTLNNTGNSIYGAFIGNGANVTNVNAATLNGLTATNFWQLGGNNVASGQFIGSMNNQPVEIWANGSRAFRLEPGSVSGAPNVIGGAANNFAASGIGGATISGGGQVGPTTNSVTGSFGTVGGGVANSAGAFAVVGGGAINISMGICATIVGGQRNYAYGNGSFIGGGGYDGITVDTGNPIFPRLTLQAEVIDLQ